MYANMEHHLRKGGKSVHWTQLAAETILHLSKKLRTFSKKAAEY